ncbi:MAG: DUF4149 domain-containing protein [Nitrospirae bacterium]|nr:DUF4149 domain-containing protein [Nitrospirota bacterium]
MWIHLLAVVTWLGGQIFLVLVARPVLQDLPSTMDPPDSLRRLGRRFRTVTWVSIITLVMTGAFNILNEGGSARIESAWGGVLMLKLFLVALVVGLTLVHDFILDPYAAAPRAAGGTRPASKSGAARGLQIAILLLSLSILLVAAYLARM